MNGLDRERLVAWAGERGGTADLARALRSSDWRVHDFGALAYDDRRLLVEGLLQLVCDPRANESALDLVERVGANAGFSSDDLDALIREGLGMSAARLRAYAVLGLPLTATADEIKQTHRIVAKALHPDRLQQVDEPARRAAEHLLGRINSARSLLTSREPAAPPEASVPDDVLLGDPEDDVALEDVPLDLGTDLTDLLEPG